MSEEKRRYICYPDGKISKVESVEAETPLRAAERMLKKHGTEVVDVVICEGKVDTYRFGNALHEYMSRDKASLERMALMLAYMSDENADNGEIIHLEGNPSQTKFPPPGYFEKALDYISYWNGA